MRMVNKEVSEYSADRIKVEIEMDAVMNNSSVCCLKLIHLLSCLSPSVVVFLFRVLRICN